jgi:L-fuconolactonase
MAVDAHHHFWNPDRIPQSWMTDEHVAIARAFEPDDLEPLLRAAGITRSVLVQSAARDDDTDSVFELARDVTWVGGIVAWCPLDDGASGARRPRRSSVSPGSQPTRSSTPQPRRCTGSIA